MQGPAPVGRRGGSIVPDAVYFCFIPEITSVRFAAAAKFAAVRSFGPVGPPFERYSMKTVSIMVLAISLAIPIASVSSLLGCAGTQGSASVLTANNITEAQTIVAGLSRIYADIRTDFPKLIGTGSAADTDVTAALAAAGAAVNGLSMLAAAGDNATALRAISAMASDVLNELAVTLPAAGVPPEVTLGLQAAQLLIPDLLTLAQSLAPSPSAMPTGMPSHMASHMPTGMPTGANTATAMAPLPARFKNPGLTKDAALSVLAAVR
jgi:hypothetical protein